jgi:hypothetical protein
MWRMRPIVSAIALALTTAADAAPTQYLCIVDQISGLHYNDQSKAWRPQAFIPGRKYVLRRLKGDDWKGKYAVLLEQVEKPAPPMTWGMFRFGEDAPLGQCYEFADLLLCKAVVGTSYIWFDIESRRFTIAFLQGYTDQAFSERALRAPPEKYKNLTAHGETYDPSHPDDLAVEIGVCTPF